MDFLGAIVLAKCDNCCMDNMLHIVLKHEKF